MTIHSPESGPPSTTGQEPDPVPDLTPTWTGPGEPSDLNPPNSSPREEPYLETRCSRIFIDNFLRKYPGWDRKLVASAMDSNLTHHALVELSIIGYPNQRDEDASYNKLMTDSIMNLVTLFADQGHSGHTAAYSIELLGKLLKFEPLSPITSSSEEWVHVGPELWQNTRNSKCFSKNGGVTYYTLNDTRRLPLFLYNLVPSQSRYKPLEKLYIATRTLVWKTVYRMKKSL